MAAAHGEQILLSAAAAELLRDELPAGASLRDLGRHHMKGLVQPEQLFNVVASGLRADFPPLTTLDVSANHLPTHLTTFIGRATEVADVKRLLADCRLTTLTGSGGRGKTRLPLAGGQRGAGRLPPLDQEMRET